MKKEFLIIAFVGILSGCATTANYKKILNTWVGSHVDNLVSSWGPPQGSFKLSHGSVVIEYINSRDTQVGGYTYTVPETTYRSGSVSTHGIGGSSSGTYSDTSTTYVQKQAPVYTVNLICKTRFTVNPQGIIAKWSWQGNNCTVLPPKQTRRI
jgi:hypothetical protein